MPIFSTSASELKYASGSSWSAGKAKQGVYSSTRYEGAMNFAGLGELNQTSIAITRIQLTVTFASAGGSSTKYLTMYRSAKSSISGSISSMRGSAIGAISVSNAYNRTTTLTFDDSSNAAVFREQSAYIMSGGRILILYVPTTRGTYSGGYCYDYLSVTAATIVVHYENLKSDCYLSASTVAAGSAATLNIVAYSEEYMHRITWKFGGWQCVQSMDPGVTSKSYTIPLTWLSAIPSATSGSASVTLDTLAEDYSTVGSSTQNFTITAPVSVTPTIDGVTAVPINGNSVLSGWGIYVYGKTQAQIAVNGAAGAYGSTIRSCSITTNPGIGSATADTLVTGPIYKTGTVAITAKVTDSRGRTATRTASISVYPYSAPYFSEVTAYRCNSGGTRDDVNGAYAYIKAVFGRSVLNGSNAVTCSMVFRQVGGNIIATRTLTSGTGVIVGGSMATDAMYQAVLTITDTVGGSSTLTAEINSAAYIMHIKKGGKALGFGMAAGEDNTISMGWALKLSAPQEIAQGGTGAASANAAVNALGAVKKSGDTMTGNLNISGDLYPSLQLLPSHNGTSNRTVFEGSYVGASSFSAWEDSSGDNRRMLEVRNAAYQAGLDNAVVLRNVINGAYSTYRLFHAGMTTAIPVENGGTGAKTAKAAQNSLGIFYADTLPETGIDGQICLVPV